MVQTFGDRPLASALGLIGLVLLSGWPLLHSRFAILAAQFGIGAAFVGHYLLLEAWTGVAVTAVGAAQSLFALCGARPSGAQAFRMGVPSPAGSDRLAYLERASHPARGHCADRDDDRAHAAERNPPAPRAPRRDALRHGARPNDRLPAGLCRRRYRLRPRQSGAAAPSPAPRVAEDAPFCPLRRCIPAPPPSYPEASHPQPMETQRCPLPMTRCLPSTSPRRKPSPRARWTCSIPVPLPS